MERLKKPLRNWDTGSRRNRTASMTVTATSTFRFARPAIRNWMKRRAVKTTSARTADRRLIGGMNMKIDVSCIDHNSAALTRDSLDGDYTGAADKDNYDRIVKL